MFRVGNKTIERFEVARELNLTNRSFPLPRELNRNFGKKDLSHGQRQVLSINGTLCFSVDYFFCAVEVIMTWNKFGIYSPDKDRSVKS